MKKSLILLGMSLLAACGVQKTELPLLPEEAFQTTVAVSYTHLGAPRGGGNTPPSPASAFSLSPDTALPAPYPPFPFGILRPDTPYAPYGIFFANIG